MANCKAMALLINQLMSAVALKEDIMVGHKLVSTHVVSGRTLIDCPGWTMHRLPDVAAFERLENCQMHKQSLNM